MPLSSSPGREFFLEINQTMTRSVLPKQEATTLWLEYDFAEKRRTETWDLWSQGGGYIGDEVELRRLSRNQTSSRFAKMLFIGTLARRKAEQKGLLLFLKDAVGIFRGMKQD